MMVQVHVRTAQKRNSYPSLAEALGVNAANQRILFLHPHDDDAIVGAGMTVALTVAEGFDVHIAIATGGQMGYCSLEDRPAIVEIRRREALASYKLLGVDESRITFFGYADGTTYNYIGRRPAGEGEPAIEGYTGMENHMTYIIRKISPQHIFTSPSTDLHPDHQAVNKELLISLYHASGDIWPELGKPCPLPQVYEYPGYVELSAPPNIMIEADDALFQRKLAAIGCYVSQKQIEATVAALREAGAVEFLRNIQFSLYHPSVYKPLFASK
jgi:LmbE family N-acetylglucosaminyl deacetylase